MLSIPSLHHDRRLTTTSVHLLLHVRAVLDVLPEIADVAADFLVGLEREGDDGDEAECEPFPGWLLVGGGARLARGSGVML